MKLLQTTCPTCGAPQVVRFKPSGRSIAACSRAPACRTTTPLPAAIEMQRAGAQPLPGLE